MHTGRRYAVTKASDDGTFEVGDSIALCPDGSIINYSTYGWVDAFDAEYARKGMVVEIDEKWVARRIDRLQKEIDDLNNFISIAG